MGRCAALSAGTEESFQKGCLSGITFDAGGLIALDRNDRRVLTLLARATERGMPKAIASDRSEPARPGQ